MDPLLATFTGHCLGAKTDHGKDRIEKYFKNLIGAKTDHGRDRTEKYFENVRGRN